MTARVLKVSLAVAALMSASAAYAQQNEMQRCAAIEDSLERLVCYDNLAEKHQQMGHMMSANKGSEKGQKMRAEKAQKRAERKHDKAMNKAKRGQKMESSESRFGMEHRSNPDDENLDKIIVEVAERSEGPYGKWTITLKNGQVWKQTEDVGYFSWDEDTYYIERGALNSFFFGREGANRRFRVKRVK